MLVTISLFLDRATAAGEQAAGRTRSSSGRREGSRSACATCSATTRRRRRSTSTRPTTWPRCPTPAGTTGLPKGVMLTHRNLVANIVQIRAADRARRRTTRILAVLPFFHIYGMTVLMNHGLRTGAHRGDAAAVRPRASSCAPSRTTGSTRAFVAPPIVLALAKHPLVDQYDLSSLTRRSSPAPRRWTRELAQAVRGAPGLPTGRVPGLRHDRAVARSRTRRCRCEPPAHRRRPGTVGLRDARTPSAGSSTRRPARTSASASAASCGSAARR